MDAGRISFEDPHFMQDDEETMVSVGTGLRWQWRNNLNFSLDLAIVTNGTNMTNSSEEKLHYNLFFRF